MFSIFYLTFFFVFYIFDIFVQWSTFDVIFYVLFSTYL